MTLKVQEPLTPSTNAAELYHSDSELETSYPYMQAIDDLSTPPHFQSNIA